MRIKIWGTRGSAPVSGPRYSQYGGDTSCIEVRTDAGAVILLDAGTGLAAFDRARPAGDGEAPGTAPVICLSHAHLDHIQGLPFYAPLYSGRTVLYAPEGTKEQLGRLFDGVFLPMGRDSLAGLEVREVAPGARFAVGDAVVETMAANHPGGSLAYRITADGRTFVYSGDHEIPQGEDPEAQRLNAALLDFMAGSDVVLVDGHFSAADHALHKGWGHSHPGQWAEALRERGVGKIVFGHFNPAYSDEQIDSLLRDVRRDFPDMDLAAAAAGCVITPQGMTAQQDGAGCGICAFFSKTAPLSDTHAVLETLLTEARRLGRADAGTVYLVEDGELAFSAAQNDTLFPASAANKFFYMNARIPVDRSSIAGYVAATGASLNIADVYALPPGCEYGFKADFDRKSGYRTGSVLAVPLLNARGAVTGVLQLINSQDGGKVVPFTAAMEKTISGLAAMATVPLERSFLLTAMILRMLKTSALRDPSETAGHVYRVGGMAAELYHRWAEAHGVEPEELLSTKGVLRLAAMLHDVGKVGIPDAVLKKPGRLDDAERAIMQGHAAKGASLFDGGSDGIDRMARDIALHHHAKWDGSGYTGDEAIPSPSGADIPLWARITAIADVYDALVSRRCYKDAWDSDKALEILQKDAGTHFDPELVKYFLEIRETIEAVVRRYA